MSVLVVLLVLAGLGTVYGMVLKKYGLKGLTCRRAFSRSAAFEGEEAELVEVIGNDRPMFVPWLRVESRISRNIRFGSGAGSDDGGYVYHQSLFTLMPYQRITRRHRVRFLKRGVYNIGNATLTAGDVAGMFQCSREQRMDVPVTVYPRLLDDRELPQPLSRLLGECVAQRRLLQDPFLINGIRLYQPGDPVRDIHWAATARTGETHVRVHDFTAQTRLMVVINAQLKEEQWDNLMEYERAQIEQAISIAATLCVRALRMGLSAGFAANMPLDDREECTIMTPNGGAVQEETLLTAFAHLRILRKRSFNSFLEMLTVCSDLDMVVLSCYDSPALQERLEALRQRGNTVRLHVLEGRVEKCG